VSLASRVAGALCLATVFLAAEVGLVAECGLRPATISGAALGMMLGLASLVVEIHLVAQAMRSKRADTAAVTFQTFIMRMVVVAPLTFALNSLGMDATAFAISYVITFFVYLCWLTWKTYHAPVQYRGRRTAFSPRVVARREHVR
jgi:hypothetical protein